MSEPETTDPRLAAETAEASSEAAVADETPDPKPPPEPMTPERVSAWNRYLDRYIAGGVILLAFIAAARPIAESSIWPLLRAGQLTMQMGPVTTDPFTYTREGQRWVNVPWLFESANWLIYSGVRGFFEIDPGEVVTADYDPARPEQFAAGALVAVNALLAGLAATILLLIRRRGPGLWWSSVCAMIALGGFVAVAGVRGLIPAVGGLAYDPFTFTAMHVSPQTWGLLLLAIELLLIFRFVELNRIGAGLALPAVFLVWANSDESFLFGLLILAAWVVGALIRPVREPLKTPDGNRTELVGVVADEPTRPAITWTWGLGIVAACGLTCLLNPSIHRAYESAARPYLLAFANVTGRRAVDLTADQVSFFDPASRAYFRQIGEKGADLKLIGFYLVVVWLGLMSFAANWRRFRVGRFLAFLIAAVFWGMLVRLQPFFGFVLAAVMALNGQEWYLATFSREGRLGGGWKLFSDGGRGLTIVAIFAYLAGGITGYVSPLGEPRFGFGFDDSKLAFGTADYLRDTNFKGRVLNLQVAHGDALDWRDPRHQSYIDSRHGVFPDALRNQLAEIRRALGTGEKAAWSKTLDELGVSMVMLSPIQNRGIFEKLLVSPDWVAIHDGGNAVLFGRVDDASPDREAFRDERLDPTLQAYRRNDPVGEPVRPPTPSGTIDRILRHRYLTLPSPKVYAAQRWLAGTWNDSTDVAPGPAPFLVAIRESRRALLDNPDDPTALRYLSVAYDALRQAESLIYRAAQPGSADRSATETIRPRSPDSQGRLAALAPTTPGEIVDAFQALESRFIADLLEDDSAESTATKTPIALFTLRYRQRLTDLNFAILTTPPPFSTEEKQSLADLHLELAEMYYNDQAVDLALDQMVAALDLVGEREFPTALRERLDQLDEQVRLFRDQLINLAASNPDQAGPFQQLNLALQNGYPGIALEQLEEAEGQGARTEQVLPYWVDLYCQIGRPDLAFERLESTAMGDQALDTGPGLAGYRRGLVHMLLGYYTTSGVYWREKAVRDLRQSEALNAISSARGLLIGDPLGSARSALSLVGTSTEDGQVETEATWESLLGFLKLEAGQPLDIQDERGDVTSIGAAGHFRKALELDPEIGSRPILLYYLEQMGVVPPDKSDTPMPETDETSPPNPSETPANG